MRKSFSNKMAHFFNRYFIFIEISLGALSAMLAFVLFFNGWDFSEWNNLDGIKKTYLMHHPKVMTWFFSAMLEVVIYFLFFLPAIYFIAKPHKGERKQNSRSDWVVQIIFTVISLALVGMIRITLVGYLIEDCVKSSLGYSSHVLITFKTGAGMLLAILCGVGMMKQAVVLNLSNPNNPSLVRSLKERLDYFLIFIGIILTVSSIQHSLFQKAYFEMSTEHYYFPEEQVYFNGLFNSFLIALIYLPVKVMLEVHSKTVMAEEKNNGGEPFKLFKNVFGRFNSFIPILSPFIGSVLPGLFNG